MAYLFPDCTPEATTDSGSFRRNPDTVKSVESLGPFEQPNADPDMSLLYPPFAKFSIRTKKVSWDVGLLDSVNRKQPFGWLDGVDSVVATMSDSEDSRCRAAAAGDREACGLPQCAKPGACVPRPWTTCEVSYLRVCELTPPQKVGLCCHTARALSSGVHSPWMRLIFQRRHPCNSLCGVQRVCTRSTRLATVF